MKKLELIKGNTMASIKPRERTAIIQSLRAGVTPRIGLEHIQVGRANEVKALIEEIDLIAHGGSSFKLIIGDYGAGKSFFMQLIRYIALEKGLVVINADLSPDRRLYASAGQARALYQELAKNISTRAHMQGNAMSAIVEKFISEQINLANKQNKDVNDVIRMQLHSLSELVGGYDFASVIETYYKAFQEGDENTKNCVIRYLRGEYTSKQQARIDLNVRTIVDDSNFYDRIKLLARFIVQAGFKGLLVNLDEMVNLYKLPNQKSRSANYEQILRILNDCLQGSVEHVGFLLGGTPEFLQDQSRGLYSYEALHSRLAQNTYAKIANVVDYKGPVLMLDNLSPEELFVLLCNIRNVFANGDKSKYIVDDEALHAFLTHCSSHIGDAYFKTPRNTIKAFVDFLSVLEQNKDISWQSLLSNIKITQDSDDDIVSIKSQNSENEDDDDDLVNFSL